MSSHLSSILGDGDRDVDRVLVNAVHLDRGVWCSSLDSFDSCPSLLRIKGRGSEVVRASKNRPAQKTENTGVSSRA